MLATRGARVARVEVSSALSPFGRAGCLSGNARPATAWSPSAAATSSSLRHSLLAGGPTGRRDLRARAKSRPLKPDDSPLRDGNRDRLLGLLTERAARTLLFYCSETNQHLYHWLNEYIKQNPIPRNGQYQDISGETFLMGLMVGSAVEASAQPFLDPLFDCSQKLTVDPRQVAQRIMDIRVALSKEFREDLDRIEEENMEMLRQSLTISLEAQAISHPVVPDPKAEEEEKGD